MDKIITSKRKNILVIAGAGCGKTYTIVKKVNYLINNLKENPKKILCISFTNEAVNKLKKDINNKNVEVLTFHRLALKIMGKSKEILSEDMLIHIVLDSFSNNILLGLYKMNKESMCLLIATFINLFKSNNYKLDIFYKMINKANRNDKLLLKEIMKCFICYESYLNKENAIDFNDMINIAIDSVKNTNLDYKYIIIDEYQDTSYTKYLLVKKLQKKTNAKVFAVGDDFQSIYRFAGSDIKLFTKFRYYFPFSKIYKLNKTYRNCKELIKIAGKFIMKNPYQIRKWLNSDISVSNPIIIVYYEDLNSAINNIIKEDMLDNILILARNNNTLNSIKPKGIKYRKLTIHKSKGLEDDYVFVLDLLNTVNGFPNKYVDHRILKYVNDYKQYYPYEEERRLFYVAITRCRKKVYLFTKENNESIFIKELKKIDRNIVVRKY